jgi:GYF domain 2
MSTNSPSWYVPGEGRRPVGPLTAEQLIESWRAGRISDRTVCWREGMSDWRPLSQTEPFASVIASAGSPATQNAARLPTPHALSNSTPPALSSGRGPNDRRRASPALIGWGVAGGLATICAITLGAISLLNPHPNLKPVGAADNENSASQNCGSPYTVDYKVASDSFNAVLNATIKGPAAKLGVILTDPKGESVSHIVEKDSMINNCQAVQLPIEDPQEGTYVLTIKTVDPEAVVLLKKFTFSPTQLTITDIRANFTRDTDWGQFWGYRLSSVQVFIEKSGNLPIKLDTTNNRLSADGKEYFANLDSHIIVDQRKILNIGLVPRAVLSCSEEAFKPGYKGVIKGKLLFGRGKCLEFQKEFVTPAPDASSSSFEPTKRTPPKHDRTPTSESSPVAPGTTGSPGSAPPDPVTPRLTPPFNPGVNPKVPDSPRRPVNERTPNEGPLAGTWQVAGTGEQYRIDDGKEVTIEKLDSGNYIKAFTAKLLRAGEKRNQLRGEAKVVVQLNNGTTRHKTTDVTGMIDSVNQLTLRCRELPRYPGKPGSPLTFVLTRPGARGNEGSASPPDAFGKPGTGSPSPPTPPGGRDR